MTDDLEPMPFERPEPPPPEIQLELENAIAESTPLDAILAQARQADEINTEQLEVSDDQLNGYCASLIGVSAASSCERMAWA